MKKMKRASVYRQVCFLTDDYQNERVRLGWCIESYVRKAFPNEKDENYVGFTDKKVAANSKKEIHGSDG